MRTSQTVLRSVLAISAVKSYSAFAPVTTALSKRSLFSFSQSNPTSLMPTRKLNNVRRFLSSSEELPQIQHIGKMELEEILEDIENGGREESGYVVIDVRGTDEISYTGKLNENVETLPLPAIFEMGVFNMEEDAFEAAFGFQKPAPDETVVFTCKAGIRSMQAAQLAGMAGYSKLINYRGGADEWFSTSPQF